MESKRYVVIGLGRFGFHLAKELHERGGEVLAIDRGQAVVQKIKDHCSQAIVADATDRETLEALDIASADVVIVGLGLPMDHSILVMLHLKELGAKNVVVKAVTTEHAKILRALGATQIIFPERDMAEKLATGLTSANLMDYLPLGPEHSIVEVACPGSFVGKTIRELDLRNQYGVVVVAVKEVIPERVVPLPRPDYILKDSDILVVIGSDDDLTRLGNVA